jgi:hypothetical protein
LNLVSFMNPEQLYVEPWQVPANVEPFAPTY